MILDSGVTNAYNELELLGLTRSRQSDDEFTSALWNRRHVKALKTAMILAIAESATEGKGSLATPVVSMEQWRWAVHYQDIISKVLAYKNDQGTFENMFVLLSNNLRKKFKIIADGGNSTYNRLYTNEHKELKLITGYMLDRLIYRYKDFNIFVNTIYRGRKTDAIRGFVGYCTEIQLLQQLDFEDSKNLGIKGKAYKFNI